MHRELHSAELYELKKAVKNFGGAAFFGEVADCDDEERKKSLAGPFATHTEMPMIAVDLHHSDGPENVVILSVSVDKDDRLVIMAERQDCIGEPFELQPDEIEFGHVSFITGSIPDNNNFKGRDLWLRAGIMLKATDEEVATMLYNNGAFMKATLREIISQGRFDFTGDTYIPDSSVEDYNEQYGAEFPVRPYSCDM